MKTCFSRFLAVCFLVILFAHTTLSFAECDCKKKRKFQECEKTYVAPEQVELLDNSIFVNIENRFVQTTALHSDGNGYYFKNFRQGDCEDGYWECRQCQHCTPNWKLYCESCWN